MKTFLKFLFIVSICFWIGTIFFFSSVTAPSIFSTLPKPLAGDLISVMFDKYYFVQYVLAVVCIVSVVLLIIMDKEKENKFRFIRLSVISAMFLLVLLSGVFIRGSALEAKVTMKSAEHGSAIYMKAEKTFKDSHRNSVIINGLVFLTGIVILFNIAKRNEL